jgi:hypothetical protein
MSQPTTIRMFPAPYSPSAQIVNGVRSYSGTPGVLQDVPVADAQSLAGWTAIAPSGPTSQRPISSSVAGAWYIDTTLNAAIVFDGSGWRNPITSALV